MNIHAPIAGLLAAIVVLTTANARGQSLEVPPISEPIATRPMKLLRAEILKRYVHSSKRGRKSMRRVSTEIPHYMKQCPRAVCQPLSISLILGHVPTYETNSVRQL